MIKPTTISTPPQPAEGVIKFELIHSYSPISIAPNTLALLNAWRHLLFRLGMLGQDAQRYDGLAFGNCSCRASEADALFWVSATQTSNKAFLREEDCCAITRYDLNRHLLYSRGLAQPSSETLTHAAIYQIKNGVNCVIHVHSPEIWQKTLALGLAHTDATISYGTHEMVNATQDLLTQQLLGETGLYTMLGHEDGVVAFAPDIEQCAELILKTWIKSISLAEMPHTQPSLTP